LDEFLRAVPQDQWNRQAADSATTLPELERLLQTYQDPQQADKIEAVKKELDETKEILFKSIDQVLQRGEKLETLVQRSEDLSFQSKAFLERSESMNRCCIIL
jgi:synaptobrevin family protein YKT6